MQINPAKVVLIIMDGWGEAPPGVANAITAAATPCIDQLYNTVPHSKLLTSGENVGLPDGQMGNSEVGHLNIGAGRVVYQELALINKAIRERTIDKEQVLLDVFEYCIKENKPLHLLGLVSDGGVHSHIDHLVHLCRMANDAGITSIYIHAFTDGRDTDPRGGIDYIDYLESAIAGTNVKIATVVGRYYAMDRDKRWERIRLAYDLLVHGKGAKFPSARQGILASYENSITDEFILPVCITENDHPVAVIKKDDAVICFNFRTDRCREITEVLVRKSMPSLEMEAMDLYYVTMTNYDSLYTNVKVVYDKDNLVNTLGEILSASGKKQLRIAETEKYPHVTFFFSGGREQPFKGEERIMISSPKVATYDLKPSMSAIEVKDALVRELIKGEVDFVCINFANADMVGHTGIFDAAIEAVETVDKCVSEILEAGRHHNYSFLITADHGNADMMKNDDGTPNTAHTTNPVPCFLVDSSNPGLTLSDGKLADLAPTILTLLGLAVPPEMTGNILVN